MLPSANDEVVVTDLSNREFLERYARAGCIGLVGGATAIDLAIRRAERLVDDNARWSLWSHAFFIQGVRPDGHTWVIESDLDIHRKHIRLGAQENRLAKYHDEKMFRNLAVLDFGLTETQVAALVSAGLDMVAEHGRYSLREIFGALIGLKHQQIRERENPLARERSQFCSAFVCHMFLQAGVDLVPGVADKHTTPEEIIRTPVPHKRYVLQRHETQGKLASLRAKMKSPLEKLRERRRKK